MGIIYRALAQGANVLPTNGGAGDSWDNLNLESGVGNEATWGEILTNITNYVFIIAGVIAFIYLIYSGFIYLTAGGNPDTAKKGQTGILNAIIGLVIIFLAYGIVRFVTNFLNTAA